jgi:hypothetical protein
VGDLPSQKEPRFSTAGPYRKVSVRGSRNHFHGDRRRGTGANDFVHGHDIQVVQGRGSLGLVNEPFATGSISLWCDYLQRDLAIEVGIVGGLDTAQSTLSDKSGDDKTTDRSAIR